MAKNIVICCDGTGNEYGPLNSNVVHLYRALVQDERQQVCYYHPGVGTQGSPTSRTRVGALLSIVAGMGWGAGLLDYVGDAYRFLMEKYEAGDRIYLFGFSRGAYTVRALSGMLRLYGLLHRGNEGLIAYILKMFARRTRKAGGMEASFDEADGFKATYSRTVEIHLVGVWDTVSSVGMLWDPLKLPYTARNPIMKHGRHAVSIDERRCFFINNLWGAPFDGQDIKQVWFAGVHSDIGGGYPAAQAGLSQITLQWMLQEAMGLGLLLDSQKAQMVIGRFPPPPPVAPDPGSWIHRSLVGSWWLLEFLPHGYYDAATKKRLWRIPLGAMRTIPPGSVFHQSVVDKLEVDPTYKPRNLPADWTQQIEPWEPSPVILQGVAQMPLGVRPWGREVVAPRLSETSERPDPQSLAYTLEAEGQSVRDWEFLETMFQPVAVLAPVLLVGSVIYGICKLFHVDLHQVHFQFMQLRLHLRWLWIPSTVLVVVSLLGVALQVALKRRIAQTLSHLKDVGGDHAQ